MAQRERESSVYQQRFSPKIGGEAGYEIITITPALGWTISTIILGALGILGSVAPLSWFGIIIKGLIIGIPLGLLQALVLRRWVEGAFRWVAAWIIGYLVGAVAVTLLAQLVFFSNSHVLY